MKRNLVTLLMLVFMVAQSTVSAYAQGEQAPKPVAPSMGFRAEFLKQLDDVEKKTIDLAQAIPQEKYAWRPGEGVRSISEVFMHVAGGNWMIPRNVGVQPPAGLSRDMEKLMDKPKVVESLKQSFEHVRQAALNKTDADLDKAAKLFGRDSTVREVFFALALHMHEHLGQSIAYARSIGVVPPWTAAREAQQRPARQ